MPDRRPHRRRPEARRRLAALKPGEAIAALSAIALFVFMFFDWYGYEQTSSLLDKLVLFDYPADAWQGLEVIRWLLLLVILVAVGTALLRIAGSKWEPAVPLDAAVAVLGGLATLVIAFRILSPAELVDASELEIRITVELGAYLALAAAAGIAVGGYRAMGERGTSFAKVADGLKPKPAPKPK